MKEKCRDERERWKSERVGEFNGMFCPAGAGEGVSLSLRAGVLSKSLRGAAWLLENRAKCFQHCAAAGFSGSSVHRGSNIIPQL